MTNQYNWDIWIAKRENWRIWTTLQRIFFQIFSSYFSIYFTTWLISSIPQLLEQGRRFSDERTLFTTRSFINQIFPLKQDFSSVLCSAFYLVFLPRLFVSRSRLFGFRSHLLAFRSHIFIFFYPFYIIAEKRCAICCVRSLH